MRPHAFPSIRTIARALAVVVAWAGVASAGCASRSSAGDANTPTSSVTTPGVQGLEIRQWPVNDATDSVARALAVYEDQPSPLDDRTRARLRGAGIRAVAVPAADLDAIQRTLTLAGRLEQQAPREFTEWTPLAAGPPWSGLATFVGDRGLLALHAGRLALFVRAWVAPGEFSQTDTPAKLRLDLMTRHLEDGAERPTFEDLLRPQPRRVLAEAGARVEALDLSTELDSDRALILVPEYPAAEWGDLARLPNYIESDPEKTLEIEGKPADRTAGPKVPPTPTLGHGLLSNATEKGEPTRKLVLVLIARTPREFRLLP
ncbi:MAG TPA: hypothetical protein VF777_15620 [Phycisphaerales bacterium]